MRGDCLKNRICLTWSWLFFVSLLLFSAAAIARHDVNTEITEPIKMNSLAIMPFVKGKDSPQIDDPMNRTLACTLEKLCLENDDEIPTGTARKLTKMVYDTLAKTLDEKLVSLDETVAEYDKLPRDRTSDTPRSMAQKLGRALNVDYVVVGSVWRYDERLGGPLAAERPASVAFAIYLVEVETGRRLWKGYFEKTQQSLSENLFQMSEFFKQGGKWLSAEQLSMFGIRTLMKKFPPVQ